MKNFKSLYKTKVINEDGVNGVSRVLEPIDWKVDVSMPGPNKKESNPEQLICLALVTCLNATIHAALKRRKLEIKSSVEAEVHLAEDINSYMFVIFVKIDIPNIEYKLAKEIAKEAESRCPVAKLMKHSENLIIDVVKY